MRAIRYPDLPVSARRADIAAAISAHQVVVVAGETGSGKTTQLPKICLDLGRGRDGLIGHTQPRRLAARTVAQRIADELQAPLGGLVGYSVRFTDQVGPQTRIRLMTDGILLAEIPRDRLLRRYDTLIIDEAHERSLNIDFLLGYLTTLLPRRPDLKLVITSATIDPQRFADHFGPDVPVVEVSGRTYPVEIRYRPLEPDSVPDDAADTDDTEDPEHDIVRRLPVRDQTEAIVDAVRELDRERPGDVLVFLSGEREIRDTAEVLRGADLFHTEVLPLYARLPTAEQQRVFAPHDARRIVLATNVAETSLTVAGIRYVIDPGTARISRYSRRLKVQRLPIEPVSRASADQRAGRCGRTSDGICIRLYSERDYESRPRFTEPEVLRTNLAAVLLQMAALRLGDVADFPFLDPPDRRSVRDGIALLAELGAFDADGRITALGRRLARLPLDPRLGRMILQAEREGCVREVLVLAAVLSIPDPRERPAEQEEQARQQHARFADEHSDFTSYLNLWNYLQERRRELSGNAFRRMCREEFLHYLRVREWQDLVGQLRTIARSLDIVEADEPAGAGRIHAALLAGLLGHVGMRERDTRGYLGTRNSRFVLAPGSVLTARPPAWVMVAELVETARLFGRIAARIDPADIEHVAGHLLQRTHSEPHWDARRGAAMAYERVTLYGLPIVARRRVGYATVDRDGARELFIRHALVERDWTARHRFLTANDALLEELRALEERLRRRDLVVDEEAIFAFYDRRIPAAVVSARHFDAWWRRERQRRPDLLTMSREDVLAGDAAEAAGAPQVWRAGDVALPVSYRFEPGREDDGVTVHVPVAVLARLGGEQFSWQVPALREELVIALLRALPKELRRAFVPIPDTARAVLAELVPGQEPLLIALQRELHRRTGVLVPLDAFDAAKLPPHLRLTFSVEDVEGAVLARGADLDALQEQLAAPVRAAVTHAVASDLERDGLTDWPGDLDELPRSIERTAGDHVVRGYPAFVDAGATVALRVFATEAEQRGAAAAGARRLLRLTLPSPAKSAERSLSTRARLVLAANPGGGPPAHQGVAGGGGAMAALLDDCVDAAVDDLLGDDLPWRREEFTGLQEQIRPRLGPRTVEVVRLVENVLAAAHEVRRALPAAPPPVQADSIADIRAQFRTLLPRSFVTRTGANHLADLTRYVRAIGVRLEQLGRDVDRDRARMQRVANVQLAYADLIRALPPWRAGEPDVRDVGRLIEEFRVSLWAQHLGTARPVSEQRIFRAIDAITP